MEGARKALDDDVVGSAFVVLPALECMVAVCIMGGSTGAGGASVEAVDGEAQLAEQCIFEGVIAEAVAWVAPRHGDERV